MSTEKPRRKSATRDRQKGATAITKCVTCSKILEESTQAVECSMCSGWYCLKCTGLSNAMYKAMCEDKSECCMYACKFCLGVLPTLKNINTNVEEI